VRTSVEVQVATRTWSTKMANLCNPKVFQQRMDKLNSTKESIESTSAWMCLWRSEAAKVVQWWEVYFNQNSTSVKKQMSLLYLANDVVQTSRQNGPEFVQEYLRVLPKAIARFHRKADTKSIEKVERLVDVWEKRNVFGSKSNKIRSYINSSGISKSGVAPLNPAEMSSQHGASGGTPPVLQEEVRVLVEKMRDADDAQEKRLLAEKSYDEDKDSSLLQPYKKALKDEMALQQKVVDCLESMLRVEQRKVNTVLGALSVLPVDEITPPTAEHDVQASVEMEQKHNTEADQSNDASKIAEQVMNDPAMLLELLNSMPK
jgi:regulator of Ty1 transposition protein 103